MPRRKTNTEFKKEVYNLVGDDYVFLEPYQGTHTKIKVRHNTCGHVYKVKPHNFLDGGTRCPYCSVVARGKARIKTNAHFQQEVFDLVGDEYTFLDAYVNAITNLRVKHNKCGHTYKVRPSNFLTGYRCPYCSAGARKTNDQFKQEVYYQAGSEYTVLEHYVNAYTKIKIKHNKCGGIYEVRPTDFLSHHTRCPYCNMPKEEKVIAKILNILSIHYEIQKTFDGLRDFQPLSYDFYIPSQNILIEYQGRQHYQPVDLYGGKDMFVTQQKHDKMKADYAKDHGYTLIAVPYTEDTFSKIKKYLIKHGLSN